MRFTKRASQFSFALAFLVALAVGSVPHRSAADAQPIQCGGSFVIAGKFFPCPATPPPPTPTPTGFAGLVKSFGPTFYYRLNESSGTVANDSSGNSLTGTYSSTGITYSASGITTAADGDTAVSLDGASGSMTTGLSGSSAITSGTHAWTISIAVNSGSTYPGGTFALWDNYANHSGSGNGLEFSYGGTAYCFWAWFNSVCYTASWLQGWHVWTITDSSSTVNIYLDGNTTPVSTGTLTNSIATSTCNLVMGSIYQNTCGSGAQGWTPGIFDEFFLLPTAWSAAQVNTAYVAENTPVTPTPSPSPLGAPVSGPFAGNAKAALCVNSQTFMNVLPTNPPGFGSASGDFAGEFEDAGYTRALLNTFWGSGSTRVGTIGNNLQAGGIGAPNTTLASGFTIPAPGGSVSITVTSGSPAGIANGSVIQVGVSSGQNSGYNSSTVDPMTVVGTLSSGYGTTTWNLTNVWSQNNDTPPINNATIPATSAAYGSATKIYGPITFATWPGYTLSFGRINGAYDSYNGDSSDGTGFDPFSIATDPVTSTQALRIEAFPMPPSIQYPVETNVADTGSFTATTMTTSSVVLPAAGGSLTINVAGPTLAQNDWIIGFGSPGAGTIAVGFLASGGNDHNTATGGANPWVIKDFQYVKGTSGGTVNSGANVVAWNWWTYFAGVIDKNFQVEYGALESKSRTPAQSIGNSPAWWTLQTQAGYSSLGITRNEMDIQEMFGPELGTGMNAGNLLWNTNPGGGVIAYWCGMSCGPNGIPFGGTGAYPWPSWQASTAPNAYHRWTGVWEPGGGTVFPPGPYTSTVALTRCDFPTTAGDSFFLDGFQLPGHLGCADLTQGEYDKEMFYVYQMGGIASSLNPETSADTTNGSFVVPSTAYGSPVVVTVSNPTNWTQMMAKPFDIAASGCTPQTGSGCSSSVPLMHGIMVGLPSTSTSPCGTLTSSQVCMYVGAENSPNSNFGSTMPSGSTIYANSGALSLPPSTWPQSIYVQDIRIYAPPLPPATPAAC